MDKIYVLIVEDDTKVSRLYEKILLHNGFQTKHTATLDDALYYLMTFNPDVVCLDWQLGEETSAPFLDYLRDFPRESLPQVLVISSNIKPHELEQYQDVIAGYTPKPILLNDLVKQVQALSSAARQRQPLQAIYQDALSDDVVWLAWVGRITESYLQSIPPTDFNGAQTLIFDISRLMLEGFHIEDIHAHLQPHLNELKRLYIVHAAETASTADYLLTQFPRHMEIQTFNDLQMAQYQAFNPS